MHAQILLNIAIEVVHITQQHADLNLVNPCEGLTNNYKIKNNNHTAARQLYKKSLSMG